MFSAQELAAFLEQWGIFAALGSLLVSIIVAILGVLPSIFITGANIILFGVYKGFFLSWVSEVIGAMVSFYLYRFGFRKKIESLAKKNSFMVKIIHAEDKVAMLALFQARVIPFIPSAAVTFAGAISQVRPSVFLLTTALGKLPAMLLESLISYDLVNIHTNILRLLVTIFLLGISYLIHKKIL